jgi:predicted carbohydrate-binding protein with CBM5 and CBM33 domain
MKTLANLNTQQRREILETYLKSGKIARVRWSTAKSGLTERSVKLWAEKILTSGDRNVVMSNPASHKPEMFTVADLSKEGGLGWSNLNLNTIEWMKLGSEEWKL